MKQLPPDTVRLLSSSQVITSVTNVVKELLENSLDAGASTIDVKLDNYGLDRIEIRDNGHGIKAADSSVMAVKHFTSKIQSHEDLEHLETYGFRGEALGSICAVAEVAITTKTEDDHISTQYVLNFQGHILSQKPSHIGQGTTVCALKLFKNLPVRRQYFSTAKRCKDELKKVQDLMMAFAIIKPDLRLTLIHNKVVLWQKAKVANYRSALLAVLGSSAVVNLLPCHHRQEEPEIFLEGFFPKPGADYSSTSTSVPDKTFIFVNNRPVHQKDIIKKLRQHYTAQYMEESAQSRYPILMLKITVSPSSVDVNLTPDKTQVLLHDKEALLIALEALLVSLYQPGRVSPKERCSSETFLSPTLKTGTLQLNDEILKTRSATNSVAPLEAAASSSFKDPLKQCDAAVNEHLLPHRQASDCSSSSSVAEDWIVNQIPGGLESNFLLSCDDAAYLPSCEENPVLSADSSKPHIVAEDWCRGTAFIDPVSGEPLQPIKIHLPFALSHTDKDKLKAQSSNNKKMVNVITEKRTALTAFDLISNRTMKTPLSPVALFEKDTRVEILKEKPTASLQEISLAVNERWKNSAEQDRKKYEEKAKKHLENHKRTCTAKLADSEILKERMSYKRKASLSNQQLLDELFSAKPQKKQKSLTPKPSRPFPCCMSSLRLRLQRLSSKIGAAPQGLRLVARLASQSAWVILCGQRLMLLNPFRVQETLLFKRLLQNNILPAVTLQNTIHITEGSLGGTEYIETLCNMEKQNPDLNGGMFISDPRLVANGFKVRLTPVVTPPERHLEVTALADCVPFLGVEDLREIMTAVHHRKAKTVQECRPLKVSNYLQSEAVRLARQMPSHLSREDVEDILRRMEQQLAGQTGSYRRPQSAKKKRPSHRSAQYCSAYQKNSVFLMVSLLLGCVCLRSFIVESDSLDIFSSYLTVFLLV
ncbi:PMS1 protein homolog 1 isoform X1 [Nerophis ophidion]|uniref:PMS1 protein homolog 1 isoform X1 n=3 Tax=Nerophis ophidion TaxID=159077 RepID=UPI002ADF26E1|nr:PMS1 protein homolog 1 isoform X1 [Nerophis ophidion]